MKKIILKTPLAKPFKETEAFLQKKRVYSYSNTKIIGNKTTYCISPYKTGTTFLSSGFDSNIAAHEPLQYASLSEFDTNFDDFFIRRLNYLNLKLECSGFMSAYLEKLLTHKIAQNLNYICIVREPSKWVNSVINYWETLDYLSFDYINHLFWKDKVSVDLIDFLKKGEFEKKKIIQNLIDFYLNFTKETFKFKNIKHVQIYDLENYAEKTLSSSLNEKFIKSNVFKRENTKKKKFANENADEEYKRIIINKG